MKYYQLCYIYLTVVVYKCRFPFSFTERKTRTIPDEGDCPIFEESLEFYIHHPEMALIRFIVLDDEFIGDDFIGQYTIPFPCIRPGNLFFSFFFQDCLGTRGAFLLTNRVV